MPIPLPLFSAYEVAVEVGDDNNVKNGFQKIIRCACGKQKVAI